MKRLLSIFILLLIFTGTVNAGPGVNGNPGVGGNTFGGSGSGGGGTGTVTQVTGTPDFSATGFVNVILAHTGQTCIVSPCTVTAGLVLVNTTAGNSTVNLPVTNGTFNPVTVCKTTGDANTVTLSPNGGDVFSPAGSIVLTKLGQCAEVQDAAAGTWQVTLINYNASQTLATHNFATSLVSGVLGGARPACGDLSDSAASCSTDTTNATNISSGSLNPTLSGGSTLPLTNSAGGTVLHQTVSLDGSGNATTTTAGATAGVQGICVSGCGGAGTALVQYNGNPLVAFTGGVTKGDYAQVDLSVNGKAVDNGVSCATGAFPTTGGFVLGCITNATTGGAGNYTVNISGMDITNTGNTGALLAANNLSELTASQTTARSNIGLTYPTVGNVQGYATLEQTVFHTLSTTSASTPCTGTSGTYPYWDWYSGKLSGASPTYTLSASNVCADKSTIAFAIVQDAAHTVTFLPGAGTTIPATTCPTLGTSNNNYGEYFFVYDKPTQTWNEHCGAFIPFQPLSVIAGGTGTTTPHIAYDSVLNSGTSFAVPAGCGYLEAILAGGGGGGGGATTGGGTACVAAGGGGGTAADIWFPAPSGSITYAIGAAGTAGSNSGTPAAGGTGGDTSITLGAGATVVTTKGGVGGGTNNATCNTTPPGGLGGANITFNISTTDDITVRWTNGGTANSGLPGATGGITGNAGRGSTQGNKGGNAGTVSALGASVLAPLPGDIGYINFICHGATAF